MFQSNGPQRGVGVQEHFPLLILFKVLLVTPTTEHLKIQTTVLLSRGSDPPPQPVAVRTLAKEFGDGLRSWSTEESHTP